MATAFPQIQPHGGVLVNRLLVGDAREEVVQLSVTMNEPTSRQRIPLHFLLNLDNLITRHPALSHGKKWHPQQQTTESKKCSPGFMDAHDAIFL